MTEGTQGTLGHIFPGPFQAPVAWGTHIWCKRDSRIWKEVSILKYKSSTVIRNVPHTGIPSQEDSYFAHPQSGSRFRYSPLATEGL